MSRLKLIMLILLALLAVSAVASNSALGIEWATGECQKVGVGKGKYEDSGCLKVGEVKDFEWGNLVALAPTAKMLLLEASVSIKGLITFSGIHIECKELKINEGFIEGKTGGGATELAFEGCAVLNLNCKLKETTIKSPAGEGISILLKGAAATAEVEFKPTGKNKNFAEFTLVGPGCGIVVGKQTVKGTTIGKILEPTLCRDVHGLHIEELPSTLKVAGTAVEHFVLLVDLTPKEAKQCIEVK